MTRNNSKWIDKTLGHRNVTGVHNAIIKVYSLFCNAYLMEFTSYFANINSYNLELKVSEFKYTFKFINF